MNSKALKDAMVENQGLKIDIVPQGGFVKMAFFAIEKANKIR